MKFEKGGANIEVRRTNKATFGVSETPTNVETVATKLRGTTADVLSGELQRGEGFSDFLVRVRCKPGGSQKGNQTGAISAYYSAPIDSKEWRRNDQEKVGRKIIDGTQKMTCGNLYSATCNLSGKQCPMLGHTNEIVAAIFAELNDLEEEQ